ncbi:MAG: response regulator [Bdellovibrionota bacterium]|nr:response regulator [Bdellovibrionota bacterium]
MSEKILVADDSPTIQKVVGITLAKSNYELYEALNEDELFQMLESDHYDLVLLDINLSEENDGYQLCEKIRSITGTTRILAMLGTFDTVEDSRLEELGVSEKVVKPFESTKFIQKIKDSLAEELGSPKSSDNVALDSSLTEDLEDEDESANIFDEKDDDQDEWSISGLENGSDFSIEDEDDRSSFDSGEVNPLDELKSEVEGWGMSVPGVIGEEDEQAIMPSPLTEASSKSDEDIAAPKSNLVSLDELMSDDDEEELDKTDPAIRVNLKEDDVNLESEINEDVSPDDFWAVDEETPAEDVQHVRIDLEDGDENDFVVEEHPIVEVGPKLEKDEAYEPTIEALNELSEVSPEADGDFKSYTPVDAKAILEELRPQLKEMIKEILQEMGAEATEKVAWEVIPDLAENLIREEVKSLSKKVQDKHSLN